MINQLGGWTLKSVGLVYDDDDDDDVGYGYGYGYDLGMLAKHMGKI